jgi:hypothetical protein
MKLTTIARLREEQLCCGFGLTAALSSKVDDAVVWTSL